jgi:hypothetical protein
MVGGSLGKKSWFEGNIRGEVRSAGRLTINENGFKAQFLSLMAETWIKISGYEKTEILG